MSWDIIVIISLSLMIASALPDELPEPENLDLSRVPFSVTATWSEPTGLDADCKVNYTAEYYEEKCPPSKTEPKKRFRTEKMYHKLSISNERYICITVRTNPKECKNKKPSKPVYKEIPPALALVKSFTCVYYSNMMMNCSWCLVSKTSDLQLFYKHEENNRLKPCISYITNGSMKRGCHLDDVDILTQETFFLFNGTVNDSKIQNSFIIEPRDSVKPETPKLTITREGQHLIFQSNTPNFSPLCWAYKFKYSKCGEMEEEKIINGEPQLKVEYDAACKYTVQTQTLFLNDCGKASESEMSEPEYYGDDGDPNLPFMVAMIITPIIVSCCVITALLLIRRYKEIILPQIPTPSLLFFKDMLNSNNNGPLPMSLGPENLYAPLTEDVEKVKLEPMCISSHSKPGQLLVSHT